MSRGSMLGHPARLGTDLRNNKKPESNQNGWKKLGGDKQESFYARLMI